MAKKLKSVPLCGRALADINDTTVYCVKADDIHHVEK